MWSRHVVRLAALSLLVACSGTTRDTDPTPSTTSPTATTTTATSPTTTTTTTTTATTSTTTTVPVDAGATVVSWLEEQKVLGRVEVITDPSWAAGEPVLVTAFRQSPTIQGDVVLALPDGRVAPLPEAIVSLLPSPPTGLPDLRLTRLGGDPFVVLVAADRSTVVAARLDTTDLTWTTWNDLTSVAPDERLGLYTAGNHVLLVHWDTSVVDAYRQWGEMVSPTGQVTTMAQPPADTPMWFTNDAGGRALLLGIDTVAVDSPALRTPVAFDPTTDEWITIAPPDWLTCSPDCVWSDRHEWPDRHFFRTTPMGVVVTLPDGSYGVLDANELTWRRVDDPPVPLPGPIAVVVGTDRLAVLPDRDVEGTSGPGSIAWLDLSTGSWSMQAIVDPGTVSATSRWDGRRWGRVLLLSLDDEIGNPPVAALDLETGMVRGPTADELAAWPALDQQVPIDDLIAAWRLRLATP